jgi:hypothetical protein
MNENVEPMTRAESLSIITSMISYAKTVLVKQAHYTALLKLLLDNF